MQADIDIKSKDELKDIIKNILTNAVLSGDVVPGEYIIVDDDGIMIGNESDFDSDVLLYAVKVDDIIDFDNVSVGSDFVNLSNVEDRELLHNIL